MVHAWRTPARRLVSIRIHTAWSGLHASPESMVQIGTRNGEAYLEDQRARDAFRLLVELAASSPRLVLSFKKKGVLKTCRLHERSGGRPRLPYSFIVNKGWVKFYFRFREARFGKDRLKQDFDSFDDSNSKGEWTVKLRTEDDVRLLLPHLK